MESVQNMMLNKAFGEAHMTFVREEIDTAERRQERDGLHLVSPVTRSSFDEPRWFVDRERGLYFVELGGGGPEIPFVFGLADKTGVLLEAQARAETVGEYHKKNIDLTWHLSRIKIRKEYAARADELLARLREALESYGLAGNSTVTKSVRVELPVPAPKFV